MRSAARLNRPAGVPDVLSVIAVWRRCLRLDVGRIHTAIAPFLISVRRPIADLFRLAPAVEAWMTALTDILFEYCGKDVTQPLF